MSGLKGTAPCGHSGTYVTANFIACDRRCEFSDAVPVHVDPEKTKPLCRHCGSDRIREYPGMTDPASGKQLYHCDACEFASLI